MSRDPVILDMEDFDPSDIVTEPHRRLAFTVALIVDPEFSEFHRGGSADPYNHPALSGLSRENKNGFYNLADGVVGRTLNAAINRDRMAVELLLHGLGHLFDAPAEGRTANDIWEEVRKCGVHENPGRLLFWLKTSPDRISEAQQSVPTVRDALEDMEFHNASDEQPVRFLGDAVTFYESVLRTCLFEERKIIETIFPLLFTAVEADVFPWEDLPLPEEVEEELRDRNKGGHYDERTDTFSDGGTGEPPEFDV